MLSGQVVRFALALLVSSLTLSLVSAESVEITAPWGKILGTLEIPDGTGRKPPVVLIIAGSGPTDRDGNSSILPGKNNCLRYLAEGLAGKGIASLRYDKRGIGASKAAGFNERELRFEDYVDDACLCVRRLSGDSRFSRVFVMGHSEGALIGILASNRLRGDVSGFISIAGAGRRADELIRAQFKNRLPAKLQAESDNILRELSEGREVKSPPPELRAIFRESVQPYLISWFRHDPRKETAKFGKPVLIAQGTTDIQVGREDAELLSSAAPGATLLLVEGMNHVLKDAPPDISKQTDSYTNILLPVSSKLVDGIASFIK